MVLAKIDQTTKNQDNQAIDLFEIASGWPKNNSLKFDLMRFDGHFLFCLMYDAFCSTHQICRLNEESTELMLRGLWPLLLRYFSDSIKLDIYICVL